MGNSKTTHLVANRVPRNIRTKIVSVWNDNDPHKPRVRLRARRFLEYVLRGPVDELGPATLRTYAGIIEVRFDLGNVIGTGLGSGGTRDAVVAGPEASVVRAVALVGQGTFAGFLRTKPVKLGRVHEVLEVGLDGELAAQISGGVMRRCWNALKRHVNRQKEDDGM